MDSNEVVDRVEMLRRSLLPVKVSVASAERVLSTLDQHNEEVLTKTHEAHKAELARRDADYTRELNQKLQQINEQTKTILSALSAIEKKNDALRLALADVDGASDLAAREFCHTSKIREAFKVQPDLSLLHQHDAETRAQAKADVFRALNVTLDALNAPQDEWPCNRISKLVAEVRKPLVDLLEGVLELYPHLTAISDALPELLRVMVCPICNHETKHLRSAKTVKCANCKRSFQLEKDTEERPKMTDVSSYRMRRAHKP